MWVGTLLMAGLLGGSAMADDHDRDRDKDKDKDHRSSQTYQQRWHDGQYQKGDRDRNGDHDHDRRNVSSGYYNQGWGNQNGYYRRRSDQDADDQPWYRNNQNNGYYNNGYYGNTANNGYYGNGNNGYYGNNGYNRGVYGNSGYGSYTGRLSSHDQYVYNQLYNNYLQAHQINDPTQIAKAESAMQTVYRKYGIPSGTPYGSLATGY
jgi:hypothetical protein